MSASGDSAQGFCADQVRARDFTSYAASLFVPRESQRAWLALAAFHSEIANIRDLISQPMPGEIRLQWWRDTLTNSADNRADALGNPVAAELLRAIAAHDLPVEALVRAIDAHVFDVYDDPMPDMAALEAHCRDTSAAMFALRAKIVGVVSPQIASLAQHAGLAEGLTGVMLALPRHAARRQLYLPADLMNLHGVAAEEVFLRRPSSALSKTLAHLRREARSQLDRAFAMLPNAPPSARAVFLPLAQIGKMLRQLETIDPFDPPIPSRLGTLWTIWRAVHSPPFKA